MGKIVIALGGNALGNDYLEQQKLVRDAASRLIKLFDGNEVIITHGNGPQVGMITKAFANNNVEMPLDCCTAMSEGYIGFHIQRYIKEALIKEKINRDVVTVVTEVTVDKDDPSFMNPTKPIGKFYTKEEALELEKSTGDKYVEDSGRGYRKVVASPKPINIGNLKSINNLTSKGSVVIACGGGGIPVYDEQDNTKVEAVIDKDLASSLLAQKVNADKFIILTAVDQAKINFGTDNEKAIDVMNVEEANKYIRNNEFKSGSMLPKVEAALAFTKSTGNETIITSLANIEGILENKNITRIIKQAFMVFFLLH